MENLYVSRRNSLLRQYGLLITRPDSPELLEVSRELGVSPENMEHDRQVRRDHDALETTRKSASRADLQRELDRQTAKVEQARLGLAEADRKLGVEIDRQADIYRKCLTVETASERMKNLLTREARAFGLPGANDPQNDDEYAEARRFGKFLSGVAGDVRLKIMEQGIR